MKNIAVLLFVCLLIVSAQATIYDQVRYILDSIWPLFYDDLPTAESVDLNRYQGAWYEIVRLPQSYENCSEGCTRAIYTLKPDGNVNVWNACILNKDQSISNQINGTAYPADKSGAKLDVSFYWPFYGDYNIIDIDQDFQWVLVGQVSRKALWILARKTRIDSATIDVLLKKADLLGFDTSKMIYSQENCKLNLTYTAAI